MMPWGFLGQRDLLAIEEMDRPDADPERLSRTYARFPVINALLSGWHRQYRLHIRPILVRSGSASMLDVGCGGGDVARSMSRWAAKDGFRLHVTAIDPDDRAFRFASTARAVDGVTYRQAHSAELVSEGLRFDVVISNHILHHLDPAQLAGVLHDSELLTGDVALHNDLKRSNAAYVLFMAGFWPLGLGSYICGDGLVSIRRSYTARELGSVAPPGWQVEANGPWHIALVYRRDHQTEGDPGRSGV
ncbi:class I SAM-dependent methyltransferase [Paenarthrobacter sp. NPDC092416]|uniref:class I SAM-dependent methyltransferase n=1 Tax=Paenarthrobacter sp. NPDC092416 TaxID=3364386 RepID=UPI00382DCE5A